MTTWAFTRHARLRMEEHGFTVADVLLAVNEPEISYDQGDRPGERIHQRGRCAVAVIVSERVIKTVLLRQTDDWIHRVHIAS